MEYWDFHAPGAGAVGRYVVALWLLLMLTPGVSLAQFGREGFAGGFRGRPPYSPAELEQRIARYEEAMRRLDANRDGLVEPREAEADRFGSFMFRRLAERMGQDAGRPIRLSQVRESLTRYYQGATSGSQPGSGVPSGMSGPGGPLPSGPSGSAAGGPAAPSAPNPPLVPGFGATVDRPAVAGFGMPADAQPSAQTSRSAASASSPSSNPGTTSAPSSPANSSTSSAGQQEMEAKVRAYAASLVKQYDKNGNGVLDKDEWGQMRGDPKAADRNADGVITVDELAARLVDYSRGRSARHSSGSPPTGGSSSAPVPGSGGKPGLRFLSPQERLPEGLPDWFRDKDKDGDGQIRMAEFAHAWSDAIAAEFAKHDLNGDGIITPQECLQALKAQ